MNDEELKKDDEINNEKEDLVESNIMDDISFVDSTEDGDALPTKDIVKKLREEIKTLRKEKEEYLTGWQRSKADYINLQKDHGESHTRSSVVAKEKFMYNLIPALDSFDMAFANKENWEKVEKNWRVGVEYIYSQLVKGLEDAGVEKIDQVDILFDPSIHESIEIIEINDESKDHKIERVVQIGYKIGHRIIRPAKVNIYEFKKE